MTISKRSRFNRSTLILVYDGIGNLVRRPYLDRWPRYRRVVYPDNRMYKLNQGDTWNGLAYRLYGDAKLWWILCEWNRVVDPRQELVDMIENGDSILVPSITRVNFDILSFGRNRVR